MRAGAVRTPRRLPAIRDHSGRAGRWSCKLAPGAATIELMGNLRRWATAVLFAWVLLMPPVLIDGTVNQKAPLSQWQVLLRFSSGAACEASRTQAEGPYDPFIAKGSAGSHAFDNELKCVSESDPRLKP